MKLRSSFSGRRPRPMADTGFTLVELMLAVFIFAVLMLGGVIFLHLQGLRLFQITETKLNVLTWSRETVGRLTDEVRSSADVKIGSMDTNGFFTGLLFGEAQQGSAIFIVTTNISSSINSTNIYYVGPSNQLLLLTNVTAIPKVLAGSVTNSQPFSLQDFAGATLTNGLTTNNGIVHVVFEFYQPARHMLGVDYYKLETSVSRRLVP